MFIDLSLPRWDIFFPQTCSIETTGEGAVNDLGEISSEPQPLAGHDAVQCQVVFKSGKVSAASGDAVEIIEVTRTEIGLRGNYPEIKAGMTAIVEGTRYKIISAGADSQNVKTRLVVEAIA